MYIIHQYVHCTVLHFVVVLLKEIYQSFGERKNIVFVLSIVNLERLIYISSVDTLNSRINIQCYPCTVQGISITVYQREIILDRSA